MILLEMILGYLGPVIAIMVWILTALASWRVFLKAGVPGWKALIPIYREYNIFRIAWKEKQFFIYIVVVIVYSVMEVITQRAGVLSIWGTVGAVLNLVVIYYEVMVKIYLARSFGRSRGFGLFLYFLEPVAISALGFGTDVYGGPAGNPDAK